MSGFKDLQIYQLAYQLAIQVHKLSLELPKFELYEQGSQIRRSSKSIKIRYQRAMEEENIKVTLKGF